MIHKIYQSLHTEPDDRCIILQHRQNSSPVRFSFGDLRSKIGEIQHQVRSIYSPGSRIGIVAENSFEWICADLALLLGGYISVPIPLQFTRDQVENILIGMDAVLTDKVGYKKISEWRVEKQVTQIDMDGTEISESILAQTKQVTDAVTEDVSWQNGDVVLIDNTRVMHGRRKIVDDRRSIFNAQSFV